MRVSPVPWGRGAGCPTPVATTEGTSLRVHKSVEAPIFQVEDKKIAVLMLRYGTLKISQDRGLMSGCKIFRNFLECQRSF